MDWQNMSVKELQNASGKLGAQITLFLRQPKPNVEGAVAAYKELEAGLKALKNSPVVSQAAKVTNEYARGMKFNKAMPANARGVQEQTAVDPGTQKIAILQKLVEQAHFELKQHKVNV